MEPRTVWRSTDLRQVGKCGYSSRLVEKKSATGVYFSSSIYLSLNSSIESFNKKKVKRDIIEIKKVDLITCLVEAV